jgi:uncharacterized OsmC-like protein
MSTAEIVIDETDSKLKDSLLNLIETIQKNPEQASATFKAKSKLENGFLSKGKIRNFEIISDEPAELGGTNEGPNPVEYVLGAFAACQEIVIKAYATVLDIDVKAVHVEVDGNLDLHGFLNITDERAGFKSVSYKTTIETNETNSEKLETLERLSVDRCPVHDIISNPVQIDGQVAFKKF